MSLVTIFNCPENERLERVAGYETILAEAKGALTEYDAARQLTLSGKTYQEGLAVRDRQRSAVFHLNLVAGRVERILQAESAHADELGPYREEIDDEYREKIVQTFDVLEGIVGIVKQER